MRSARLLHESPLEGTICVADRDFDQREDLWPEVWCLVFYDDADSEAMVINSHALDRFLDEWASKSKLAAAGGVTGVRAVLFDATTPLSALRTANAKRRMGLAFDAVDLLAAIDKKDAHIKVPSLVGRLAQASSSTRGDIEDALSEEPRACPHTGRLLARGRDLLAVLSVLLRQRIGNLSRQQVSNGFAERSLRLAADKSDFNAAPFTGRVANALDQAKAA